MVPALFYQKRRDAFDALARAAVPYSDAGLREEQIWKSSGSQHAYYNAMREQIFLYNSAAASTHCKQAPDESNVVEGSYDDNEFNEEAVLQMMGYPITDDIREDEIMDAYG
eukprot:7958340-Karenia_brevis.AAC.1